MESGAESWKRCSSCKAWIDYGHPYYVCSVSTCNRKRTALAFCSVACWEVHVPVMRHRDSGAIEERSPTRDAHARALREEARSAEAAKSSGGPRAAKPGAPRPGPGAATAGSQGSGDERPREPRRTVVRPAAGEASSHSSASSSGPGGPEAVVLSDDFPVDVLVIASKLKQYVRARCGMNTSDAVMKALSDHVRALCDEAIQNAGAAERKTVMDRDFPKPR